MLQSIMLPLETKKVKRVTHPIKHNTLPPVIAQGNLRQFKRPPSKLIPTSRLRSSAISPLAKLEILSVWTIKSHSTTGRSPTYPANLDPHWPELVGAVRVGCPQVHAMPTCSGKNSCQTRLGCKNGPTIHAQK